MMVCHEQERQVDDTSNDDAAGKRWDIILIHLTIFLEFGHCCIFCDKFRGTNRQEGCFVCNGCGGQGNPIGEYGQVRE
jgi:hypothetical protein